MTPEQLAYLAGALDNIGRVEIESFKKVIRPKICLRSVDRRLLDHLSSAFGGAVVGYTYRTGPVFVWERVGASAQDVIRQIRPFLIHRKAVADYILNWVPRDVGPKPKPKTETKQKENHKPLVISPWAGLVGGVPAINHAGARKVVRE